MSDARFQQIVTAILAAIITLTVCAMWLMGVDVPELAKAIMTLVIGFFFGNVKLNGFGGNKNRPPDAP